MKREKNAQPDEIPFCSSFRWRERRGTIYSSQSDFFIWILLFIPFFFLETDSTKSNLKT